jgi:hypothetical protein
MLYGLGSLDALAEIDDAVNGETLLIFLVSVSYHHAASARLQKSGGESGILLLPFLVTVSESLHLGHITLCLSDLQRIYP